MQIKLVLERTLKSVHSVTLLPAPLCSFTICYILNSQSGINHHQMLVFLAFEHLRK